MSISRQYWKFFLVDTPTGLCYYKNASGMIAKASVLTGQDLSLPQSPGGWEDMQLTFGRSQHYWGLNRTFSIPLKFIKDGADIIRHLFYNSRGIETQVTLVICKWDDVTGVFRLYYSGQLDLTKMEDLVAEGITCNIMQGGVVQAMKAYENTVFEIPCDGSIPENVKVNCDGVLYSDIFHYQILNIVSPYAGAQPLPCGFVSNDGDNIGVTHNNQQLDNPYSGYFQKSSNFLFSSQQPVRVRIKGNITILPDWRISNTEFYLFMATSLSATVGTGQQSHSVGLVRPFDPASQTWEPLNSQLKVTGQIQFAFDAIIDLSANENLFLWFFNDFAANPLTIVGGSFTLSFNSRFRPSRVWGIRPYDLGKLLIQQMNKLSSNFLQTFNYGFDSNLLKLKQNLVITSGDALRASTDPNYFQYFNQTTLNPTNPNNQFYNQFGSQGPTIKTTISDFFDFANAILNASLSNQQLPGAQESIFIEGKNYVLDSSSVTMTLTKIANFRVSIASEYLFNWMKIGYQPQNYDEKAGKYEYNSLNQWQTPIRSLQKILEIICKYRADSRGIEAKRSVPRGDSRSYNDGDSNPFVLNTDFNSSVPDFYNSYFISGVPDATSLFNTNQKIQLGKFYQPVYMDNLDGEYFTSQNDFSIFMFNQPSPGTRSIVVGFTALLNGLPGDTATIQLFINGVVVRTWSQAIAGVNTAFNVSEPSFNRAFVKGDNIYMSVSTVRTCTIEITDCQINIGAGYWSAETAGPVNIEAGTSQVLISLPIINATLISIDGANVPVVSSGYQYFTFLSLVHNRNFNWEFGVSAYHNGLASETAQFDVWKNGVNIGTVSVNGDGTTTWYNPPINGFAPILFSGNIDFNLYDVVWITASCTNINTWITNCQLLFSSTAIIAYNLLRKAYNSISGVPNPQTAFNIEDLTPARMLKANGSIISPAVFNLAPGSISFQTADKNQFLSTTDNEETITENSAIDIHDLDDPLFYPLIFEFDTEVDIHFADLFNSAVNGHIAFEYNNKIFYGFPIQVTAKPAFNESQTWKLLCSPKTNLSDLVDLDWEGIPILMPFDISIPIICPIHFVPLAYVKDSRFKNYTMDEDWFRNRIKQWIDQRDYTIPRESDEPIELQCQTNGLSPTSVQVLNFQGEPIGSPQAITSITDAAINSPQLLFQGAVDISTLVDGVYYLLWSIGSGEATGVFISEGIYVKQNWDESTIRLDYSNSRNKLATIFTSYRPSMRIHGQINRYNPRTKFSTFVDQPQDIDLLNAVGYDTWKLEIGRSSGVPDYLMRKIGRIFDLDTVLIDGNQYTRDADAQWEQQTFPGQPKAYMTLDIRRANNVEAITMNTAGQLTSDMSGGYTLDPTAFGLDEGQPLIEVGS